MPDVERKLTPNSQRPTPKRTRGLVAFSVLVLLSGQWLIAERFGYPPEEFTARRERLVNVLRAEAPEHPGAQ